MIRAIALVSLLALATVGVRAADAPTAVDRIAEGVYAFRSGAERSLFLVTGEGVIVTDPLNTAAARAYREAIATVTDEPVKFVAYSHYHWDRVSGGAIFQRDGATFVAQQRCAERFRANPNPEVVMPDVTFSDRYVISLGGRSLELHYFGPSHGDCLTVFMVEPANMLQIVELVNPPRAAFPDDPSVPYIKPHNLRQFFRAVGQLAAERGVQQVIASAVRRGGWRRLAGDRTGIADRRAGAVLGGDLPGRGNRRRAGQHRDGQLRAAGDDRPRAVPLLCRIRSPGVADHHAPLRRLLRHGALGPVDTMGIAATENMRTAGLTWRRSLPVLGWLLLLGSARADVISQSPEPLYPGAPLQRWETEKIADDVYGFRYSVYRSVFMVTDEGVIVADPINVKAAAILHDEIRKLTDLPVKYVAYSHSHWDHAAGARVFKDEGATVVAQEQCAANLRENPHSDVVMPDVTFADYYRISLGGRSLDLHYFGPSHDNCLVVMRLLPANMLFVVDIANPPSGWHMPYNPTFSEDRVWNMVAVLAAAEDLVRRERIETMIGGHISTELRPGSARPVLVRGTLGPAAAIAERREFLQAAIDAVRAELAAGTPVSQVPDALVARRFLADRVLGYDAEKMRMLLHRIANYAVTGE